MSSSSNEGFLAVCGTFTGLCTIFVGLRFYARRLQKLPLMADDWLMIPTLVSYVGAATCCFISVADKMLGYSSHDFTLAQTMAMAHKSQQLYFAIGVLLSFTLAFTKMSALFFYRRVFCTGHNGHWFNIATIATIVIVACWLVTFEFLAGFECGTHFSALWDGTYEECCSISFPYLYGLAISDFLLDVWILVLPIPVILRLHMTPSRKLSIIGLFLLAFIGLGAAIARMVQYIQVETGGDPALFTDLERADTKSFYFAMLEAGISVVAVNLPSLWLFFTSLMPEKLVRSVRSIISLASRSGLDSSSAAGASGSATRLGSKPDPLSSIDSGRPDFPSELRYNQQVVGQQLSGNPDGHKVEAIAMYNADGKEQQGEKTTLYFEYLFTLKPDIIILDTTLKDELSDDEPEQEAPIVRNARLVSEAASTISLEVSRALARELKGKARASTKTIPSVN
ncbi:hypothetical protein G7Y89_g6466 [Cudoniella acicularis]|uniref:Rhodopsin domain-containing protein n=1 Tax=Cudoniella acicularis TaxID=354080 RepID=A0A8H4W2E5_9HELO|nr:hypothetical protein G7Y89_g6466 [Cudoniella acicularis]